MEVARREALIQTILKFTPVCQIYRGGEDWEQSFIGPDNRRALDLRPSLGGWSTHVRRQIPNSF